MFASTIVEQQNSAAKINLVDDNYLSFLGRGLTRATAGFVQNQIRFCCSPDISFAWLIVTKAVDRISYYFYFPILLGK